MNVTPKDGNGQAQSAPKQMSPRERAINAFKESQAAQAQPQIPQQSPVLNPTQVSPEELSVVSPPKDENEDAQVDTVEASSEVVESAPEAPKEATKEEAPLSSQFAVLARKEKALRAKFQAQEQAFKAREAAIRQQEEAIKAKDAEYATKYISRDRIKEDAWSVLNEEGISYDQLTERALAQSTQDPATRAAIARLEARLAEQDAKLEQANKSVQEAQSRSYQDALKQIERDATQLINNDPAFEMIKETKQVKEVVRLIEQTFREDGELLSVEEAAQMIEDEIIEEALKLVKKGKIQKRLSPQTPAKSAAPKQPDTSKQPQTPKTLSNSISSSRQLSARERAILAFNKAKQ